jgi:acyl-CoA thioester hydrolase
MSRSAPGRRVDYLAFTPVTTRWQDNDAYGHMNNATYLSIFDTVLTQWQLAQGMAITSPNGPRFLMVESGCRYHAEVGFPDPIDVGLRVTHIGTSSCKVELGMFRQGDESACAEAFFVQVHVTPAHRPQPMPPQIRDILASHRIADVTA